MQKFLIAMTGAALMGLTTMANADSPDLTKALKQLESLPKSKVIEDRTVFQVDGQDVIGTLARPDDNKKHPVILLLHGFTGTRDEMMMPDVSEGVFKRTARIWGEHGYSSLRIDFRGSGESASTWAETTFDRQIEDALAALDFLKTDKRVDGKRIAVVGWSQGGLVASAVAGKTPSLRGVGLWSPVASAPMTFTAVFGPDTMKEALKPGAKLVSGKILGTSDTAMNASFFKNMYTVDPIAEIVSYKGPLFVAVGTEDAVVAPQPVMGQLFLKYHDGREELWVRDMDHDFSGSKTSKFVDEMAPSTLAFLRKGLDK